MRVENGPEPRGGPGVRAHPPGPLILSISGDESSAAWGAAAHHGPQQTGPCAGGATVLAELGLLLFFRTMADPVFTLQRGDAPLLISIPHLGTAVPEELRRQWGPAALSLRDTDWHLDRLYGFAQGLGATVLGATVSRYVIDLNRPPDGHSLYPGQTSTGLCPTETFRGEPLYPEHPGPDEAEVQRRRERYWQPYHQALQAELERLRARHGRVLLWEAHSIASVLPRLFSGTLPDFNFGSYDGASCAPALMDAAVGALQRSGAGFSRVVNGRFKGGYITRHYGAPGAGVHAIQLEMAQHLYMNEEAPFDYRPEPAGRTQAVLAQVLGAALAALLALPAPRG